MTGRTGIVFAATLLTATATATAFASGVLKNPKALVLQQSDFARGATAGVNFTAPGTLAKTYSVTFNFRNGSREEEVTSSVAVARNSGNAARVYKITVGGNTGFKGDTVFHLPAYGDEQYADFNPTRARGELIVRKGTVVWDLTVENCGPLAPAGCLGGATPPKMTKAQALAELKRYARKQKARIGGCQ